MPQGLPKKIEFNLLLADLAVQIGNLLLDAREILGRHRHIQILTGQ
jgi:hypothetical protein